MKLKQKSKIKLTVTSCCQFFLIYDQGYWNQLEAYISEHSEAQFSHGYCPECAEKVMSEYKKKRDSSDRG